MKLQLQVLACFFFVIDLYAGMKGEVEVAPIKSKQPVERVSKQLTQSQMSYLQNKAQRAKEMLSPVGQKLGTGDLGVIDTLFQLPKEGLENNSHVTIPSQGKPLNYVQQKAQSVKEFLSPVGQSTSHLTGVENWGIIDTVFGLPKENVSSIKKDFTFDDIYSGDQKVDQEILNQSKVNPRKVINDKTDIWMLPVSKQIKQDFTFDDIYAGDGKVEMDLLDKNSKNNINPIGKQASEIKDLGPDFTYEIFEQKNASQRENYQKNIEKLQLQENQSQNTQQSLKPQRRVFAMRLANQSNQLETLQKAKQDKFNQNSQAENKSSSQEQGDVFNQMNPLREALNKGKVNSQSLNQNSQSFVQQQVSKLNNIVN